MKLELIGHDEKYALEQSLLTLFPGEKPVYGTVDETSDTRWARVTLTEEDERVQVTTELGMDGKSAAHSYDYPLSGTEYEKEGQRRHAVGISFFGRGEDLLGHLPRVGEPDRRAAQQGRAPRSSRRGRQKTCGKGIAGALLRHARARPPRH